MERLETYGIRIHYESPANIGTITLVPHPEGNKENPFMGDVVLT